MEFAQWLRLERTRLFLRQSDLAEKIGVTTRTIVNYENGTKPSQENRQKLERFFGKSSEGDNPTQFNAEFYLNRVGTLFAGGISEIEDKQLFMQSISEAYEKCLKAAQEEAKLK